MPVFIAGRKVGIKWTVVENIFEEQSRERVTGEKEKGEERWKEVETEVVRKL